MTLTRAAIFGMVGILGLAACSSSSSSSSSSASSSAAAATTAGPTTTAGSTSPASSFSTSTISGVGTVVVDGQGRTVYVLTADKKTNLPCTDANGCTKFWPDLPLDNGATPTAGTGIDASLLKTMKSSDGQTYPTYNGWLMYEFVMDTAAGQAHGIGVKSFGGTWYALGADGNPVAKGATTTTAAPASSGSGY